MTHAPTLLGDLEPEAVLGDKGYDSDDLVTRIETRGAEVVIPPRANRKEPREYDQGRTRSGTKWSDASAG